LKVRKNNFNYLGKSLKIWTKMAPSVCRKTSEDHFFGGHTKTQSAKVGRQLFGQVWENLGKNPLHPQKFACSYTYADRCFIHCLNHSIYDALRFDSTSTYQYIIPTVKQPKFFKFRSIVHEYASELTTTPKAEFFAVANAGNF